MRPTCVRRSLVCVVSCSILVSSLATAPAAVLTWQGDVDNNWFTNQNGNTNWVGNVLPQDGDEVVFLASGGRRYNSALDLDGRTISLNSITVGEPGDEYTSDFLVSERILAANGTIRLGSGGLSVYLPVGTNTEARNVRFDANIEFTASSFVRSRIVNNTVVNGKQRQVYLNGQLSGGSSANPIPLEFSSPDGGDGDKKAIVIDKAMPNLYGALKLNGTIYSRASDAIWGNPSSVVQLSSGGVTNLYAFKAGGSVVVENDLVLQASRPVLLSSHNSNQTWTFTGDITGGSTDAPLDLLAEPGAKFVFAGTNQSFKDWVRTRSGTDVVIAGAGSDGIAWPSVPEVRLKFLNYNPGVTGLKLRGNYTLNAPINVPELATSSLDPVVVGQANDGLTAFNAAFNGRLTVSEDDYSVLQLTADAGGSASFNGEINIAGGTYGFDKIGAGRVAVNHRVSRSLGDTNPIGTVNVQQGTLLVNNPGGANSFHASRVQVADGAVLGGSGTVSGDVVLGNDSVLAPGSSIGTFTIGGNADFTAGGVLEMHLDGAAGDRLDVLGLLDLSGTDDTLLFDVLAGGPGATRILATYGSLDGVFNNVIQLPTGAHLDYQYLGAHQIALVFVPEPGTMVLVVIALGLLSLGIGCGRSPLRGLATAGGNARMSGCDRTARATCMERTRSAQTQTVDIP